jgi:mRNA-degrading endonuclease RelE of RelBE toxin-antitoxin system
LRTLAKKYRHIRSDLQPVIEQLQAGDFVGDRIPKTQGIFYKVRIKNSDIQKGKSGGYRLIYHLQGTTVIILMTIYAKSQQEDISAQRIQEILREFND